MSGARAVPRLSWLVALLLVATLASGCEPQPSATPGRPATTPSQRAPTDTSPPTRPVPTDTPGATETPVPEAEGGLVGAQVGPEQAEVLCSRLQQDGVAATVLWVRQGDVDQGGGQYAWDELDRQVEMMRACGLEVALHVQARDQGELSAMPQDLGAYTRFLTALASHLRGRVRRYAIENEAMSPSSWRDSPESYFQLLDAAYPAVKAADPEAIVLDSGLSSAALGLARAHGLYQAGQRAEALALAQQTLAESAGGLPAHSPQTEADLDAVFRDPLGARIVAWLPLLVEHQASYDALQVHYYGPPERLPDLLRWLREQGVNRPLEAWELGRRYQGQAQFDETAFAQESARLLATAAGEGSRFSVFVRFLEWKEKGLPGLVTRQGARPAAVAFRVVAWALNGFQTAEAVDLGPGVRAYRFTRSQGQVYVLWAEGEPAMVSLPLGGGPVTVTDLEGRATTADPARLSVGPSPVVVGP